MKKMILLLANIILASCTSSPPKDDPTQNLIYKIISQIGQHEYEQAKDLLNEFKTESGEVEYFVRETHQHSSEAPKYKEVTFKISDMKLYLDDLITAKNIIDVGCSIENENIKSLAQESLELSEATHPNFTKLTVQVLEKAKECIEENSRGSGNEYIKLIQEQVRDAIRNHEWNYFEQKGVGFIFGAFKVPLCGDSMRELFYTTKDVFSCYRADKLQKAEERYQLAYSEFIKNKEALEKEETKMNEEKLAREDADGTSLLNSYCYSLGIIKKTNEDIAHENQIAKEVGMVDKRRLYNAGQTLVDYKSRARKQEDAYKKLVGKKLTSTMCAKSQYPL